MESPDGIGDDEVEYLPSEHEPSQQETEENSPVSRTLVTYPKPKEAKTPQQRADDLTDTILNFRIAHAGDGLLRGNFGNIPDLFRDLDEQVSYLQRATDQFKLEGDDLNVSGSFDRGYTVSRENPCDTPQESTDA